jgi:hypothetical protein
MQASSPHTMELNSNERKSPTCSHCLQAGHTKASKSCPLLGKEPALRDDQKASNRWTEQHETTLVEMVNAGPLEIDWNHIAEVLEREETPCKNRYRSLVTPVDEVRARVQKVSASDILALAEQEQSQCSTCSRVFYDAGHVWKDSLECDECYSTHNAERRDLWRQLEGLFSECVWCGRKHTDGVVLQLDHLNMFEKSDSICSMVRRGESIEKMIEEASRCQVLCASCHALVTALERKLALHRAKNELTRAANAGLESDEQKQRHTSLAETYDTVMHPMYDILRKTIMGASV